MSEAADQDLSFIHRPVRRAVAEALARTPICAVVRTLDPARARHQCRQFINGGLELIEVTFTVPDAPALVGELLRARGEPGPPFIGMGTVSTPERAVAALRAGAEFVVTPNVCGDVARLIRQADLFLVIGAATATEIVAAHRLGADLVKVFPAPALGGPRYLAALRQPLADIPMLAGGGPEIEDLPAYLAAGVSAFGLGGAGLLGATDAETEQRIERAIRLARGGAGGGR